MKACALTTIDNPWSPFTNFRDWLNFDESHGYGSCSIVARLAPVTDDMTPSETALAIENAIDSFVLADPSGLYIKVYDDEDDEDFEPLYYDENDDINKQILKET